MNLSTWLGRTLSAACLAGAAAAPAQQAPTLPTLPAAWPQPAPPPAAPAAAASAPAVQARDLLPSLIEHSRASLRVQDGRLQGPGAARLRELAAASHFVLLAEDHGSRGIAQFATGLWNELATLGWRHAAIETDPWGAQALERGLREGGGDGTEAWHRFLRQHGGGAVPFFGWDAEIGFALAVVRTAQAHRVAEPVLWGLDQVFIGSAPWQLQALAAELPAGPARELANTLAQRGRESPAGLMAMDDGSLARLREGLSPGSALEAWLQAAQLSRRIYGPFTGGAGEPMLANQERETLMKRGFAAMLEAASTGVGGARAMPRVMLKFGASHLYRGASPNQVQALGGFVSELAVLKGVHALNVLVLCPPGSAATLFDGRSLPCNHERYGNDWAFLTPYLHAEGATMFDLRSWRLRPRRYAHLSAAAQRAIESFDVLVFPATSGASAYPSGVTPPRVPGG